MKLKISSVILVHWLLYATIVLLAGAVIAGGYFIHDRLTSYITTVDHLKTDADINDEAILNAQRLSVALETHRDSVKRAEAIVADTKYYEYQDQIVRDITSYANAAGVTILGFDFPVTTSAKGGSAKGVKSVAATISLASPVPYDNYLNFLKLIERNLTKMQVSELNLTSSLSTFGRVGSPTISMEVYVR